MNTDRLKMVEKVRALLALAHPDSNSSEHERESAKQVAQKLITEHAITKTEFLQAVHIHEQSMVRKVVPQHRPQYYRPHTWYTWSSSYNDTGTTTNTTGSIDFGFIRIVIS